MIDFKCDSCGNLFEELVEAVNGLSKAVDCPKCHVLASMVMDINKRVHRAGNRYRDVSWSTWSIS
jgi:putative FmdB family regulatory protein